MLSELKLPFITKLEPVSSDHLTPNIGQAALWLWALDRQLKRKWPYKVIIKLEDARAAIWSAITEPKERGKLAIQSSWQSQQLSVLDAFASVLTPPPPIEARKGVDAREVQ